MVMAGGSSRNGESVVPAGAEHHGGPVVCFLDQRLHFAKAGHALGVGIFGEGAESPAECMLLCMADVLFAEVDHLVAEQRVLDFRELCIGDMRNVDTADSAPMAAASGNAVMCRYGCG